jgi:chitinase
VILKASASGSVASVSYYANGLLIGTKTSPPYQKNWNNVAAGTYTIYAVALQSSTGLSTTSAPITITVGTPPPTFGNQGFETPFVGSGPSAYVYGPTGASWTFTPAGGTGGSGVSGNGSNFTLGNPNAPFGLQVGFIQGATTIAQTVNFSAGGNFHLTFYAAQRSSNQLGLPLPINILVDGNNTGTITPTSTSYVLTPSNTFSVSAGNHTITFQGVNPNGYDLTIFLDNVLILSP